MSSRHPRLDLADFSRYTPRSPDSPSVAARSRCTSFFRWYPDAIVATDHTAVCDYAAHYIQELCREPAFLSALGDEITTYGWGHVWSVSMPRS